MMQSGTIYKLNEGFGFITGTDGESYFFHRTGLLPGMRFNDLSQGDAVVFVATETAKGPRAEEVARA